MSYYVLTIINTLLVILEMQQLSLVFCISFRWVVIFVLHMLAFFEPPSSLSWTADIRRRGDRVAVPCWLTECIELVCLLLLLADNVIRVRTAMFLNVLLI